MVSLGNEDAGAQTFLVVLQQQRPILCRDCRRDLFRLNGEVAFGCYLAHRGCRCLVKARCLVLAAGSCCHRRGRYERVGATGRRRWTVNTLSRATKDLGTLSEQFLYSSRSKFCCRELFRWRISAQKALFLKWICVRSNSLFPAQTVTACSLRSSSIPHPDFRMCFSSPSFL